MFKRDQIVCLKAVLVILAVLASGCTANKKPSSAETTLANAAKDVVIPLEAEDLKNPLPANSEVNEAGKKIFLQSCALCHGTAGRGDTTIGQAMYPPAMDLTSPHVQHWDDGELYWIIQNGVRLTGMPAWKGSLSVKDTWKLVHFIRQLPRMGSSEADSAVGQKAAHRTKDEMIAYGRTLYRQEGCFICHQFDGEGGHVGPDLTIEGTRGRSAEWLVGHFKNPPKYTPGSIMPSFKNLTDEQLQALTIFLMNQKGEEVRTKN